MSRLYGVALISKKQSRDLSIKSVLNESFDKNDYIYTGEFDYIFDLNNILNVSVSINTKVYKTLNGAKRLRDQYNSDISARLKYAKRDSKGKWVRTYNGDHTPVVIDITEEWDSVIDNIIKTKSERFDKEITKLRSKKST